jgi:hypothetical protein
MTCSEEIYHVHLGLFHKTHNLKSDARNMLTPEIKAMTKVEVFSYGM